MNPDLKLNTLFLLASVLVLSFLVTSFGCTSAPVKLAHPKLTQNGKPI